MTERPPVARISAFREEHRAALLDLSQRAWEPVMPRMRAEVPGYVYDAFYPQGWWMRQRADVEAVLDDATTEVLVAVDDRGDPLGWVGVRIHPEDSMGEVHIVAVDPLAQRRGVARALLDAAHDRMRDAGMTIAMVETGGDAGHAPSRATYEALGYERWPVARYFRPLDAEPR